MIPILLLVGFVNGLLPGLWRVAVVVPVGTMSVLLLATDNLITQPIDAVGVFGLAFLGPSFAWLIRRLPTHRPCR
ncbi:MAG TPA: hypothetical protein VD789_04460 [Thermomicrobiales bacterium]|nr:hypothetical protein [Thermomicrobiales bacterium]